MNRLKSFEKIMFAVLFAFFIFITIFVIINKKTDDEEKPALSVYSVQDENRFLTISSAVNIYVTHVKDSNSDALLTILDKKYVKENEVNKANVLNVLAKYDGITNVNVRRAYQVNKYDNIYIYYVKAKLETGGVLSSKTQYVRDDYYEVTINENDLTFAIAPLAMEEYERVIGDVDG